MSSETATVPDKSPRRALWRRQLVMLSVGFALVLAAMAGLALSGLALPVPKWAIARVEAQLNRALSSSLPNTRVEIQGISLSFGKGLAPLLVLSGGALQNLSGTPVFALPQARILLSRQGMLAGELHLRDVALDGANIAVTRDLNGQIDIAFAAGAGADVAQIFALTGQFFASPLGRDLRSISVADMTLSLHDMRSDQRWSLQDTTFDLTHRGGALAANLGLNMAAQTGAQTAAQAANLGRVDIGLAADLTADLGQASAQLSANISDVLAKDLAAGAPSLAFMSVLDAPISGQLATTLTPNGLSALQAQLTAGAGALAPSQNAAPIRFQSAKFDLNYDPASGRINVQSLDLQSDAMQLKASGHADALRADGSVISGHLAGEWPSAFALKLHLDSLRLVSANHYDTPVQLTQGSADLTVQLSPFVATLGAARLHGNGAEFTAKGQLAARQAGWQTDLDIGAQRLSAQQLLSLWPKTFVKGTRAWLAQNLLAAQFDTVALALQKPADSAARLDLSYHFRDMSLTPMRSLPPITQGAGYGAVSGQRLSIALQSGKITPPLGGDLDVSGSTFTIPNIGKLPGTGQLTLQSRGAVTATLSLLDQPPFAFLTKSGRSVDFAQGTAKLTTHIALPLQPKVDWPDISLQVAGQISSFSSDTLVAGHTMSAPKLDVFVTKEAMRLGGQGEMSAVPFKAVYTQSFSKAAPATVTGTMELDDAALRVFGVKLPSGYVTGRGQAQIALTLPRAQPGQLVVTSDLRGIGVDIGAIGVRKSAKTAGDLRAEITLGSPVQVTSLSIQAGDMAAKGRVQLGPKGALKDASFDDVTIGKWFAGAAVFTGNSGSIALDVPRGTVDLRHFSPKSGGSGAGLPIRLRLDKLRVSDGITLTGFQADLRAQSGGLKGNFAAQVAQGSAIQGQLAPSKNGTQIRVTSQNAGAALAQAGVFFSARGGRMDLVLRPMQAGGSYLGSLEMKDIRVQSSSVLAELLNAISVVGLLDQLGGTGILFNTVTGQFLLTPKGIELREGAATGASLGVSMQGTYRFGGKQLQMQGAISPIYLINGIGEAVSKRGEGVLAFNYNLRGTSDAPTVQVNPLSVLLPGFLRNIFKVPPATLDGAKP